MKRLLIVDPDFRYDRSGIVRGAIQKLAGAYPPGNVFVVYDSPAVLEYLGRRDLIYLLRSRKGVLEPEFRRRLLDDCGEVTICGHTFDSCHHTAYQDIVYNGVPQRGRFRLVVPTHAATLNDSGKSVRSAVDDLEAHYFLKPKEVPRYVAGKGGFVSDFTPAELATLTLTEGYFDPLRDLFDVSGIEIEIDGRTVFSRNSFDRTVVVSFENRERKAAA